LPERKPRKRQGDENRGRGARSSAARGTASRGTGARGKPARGKPARAKRTSKNSDERNPTKSGVDYPSRKYRAKNPAAEPEPASARSSLRKVTSTRDTTPKRTRKPRALPPPRKRRGIKTTEATEELAHLAGRNARRAQQQLAAAADAFSAGRERDAMRALRPLRDAYPDASAVRELLGLCHYRIGQYAAAAKELDAFVALTDSVEQHPVLMDCNRALGKYRRVDELWEELAAASPSSGLVTEGRIVLAGARADRGRMKEAIATLDRRAAVPARVQDHHLRLWYALADLYERAGEIPKARDLFTRVRRYDAGFADVAERLAALR
jgi:tetratricopeptide (TPR) repeat protein